MANDRTRIDIWQGLWDAKRMGRYYSALQQRYQRIDRIVVGFLLLSGTGSVATLWDLMQPWTQPVFGLGVAAITIWSVPGRYSAKAAVAHSSCQQCNDLAIEWRTLLADLDGRRIDDEDASQALNSLDHRMGHVTARSGDVGLSTNYKINEKSAKEAAKELELSYA